MHWRTATTMRSKPSPLFGEKGFFWGRSWVSEQYLKNKSFFWVITFLHTFLLDALENCHNHACETITIILRKKVFLRQSMGQLALFGEKDHYFEKKGFFLRQIMGQWAFFEEKRFFLSNSIFAHFSPGCIGELPQLCVRNHHHYFEKKGFFWGTSWVSPFRGRSWVSDIIWRKKVFFE